MSGSTPHDRLFKATFTHVDEARGLLQSVLPEALSGRIDWSTLRPMAGSFVGEALRFRHTDLLFGAQIAGREARLYVVVEHQSSHDPLMAFRMLVYVTRVLESHLADPDAGGGLPMVVPVVISHAEGGWTAPMEMAELFDVPEGLQEVVRAHLPSLRYWLDDLHATTEDALGKRPLGVQGRLTLLALREARVKAFARALRRWGAWLQALERAPEGIAKLSRLLEYILFVGDEPAATIRDVLKLELSDEAIEGVMTTAEQLLQQGREEGRQEGHIALLEKQMRLKFGAISTVGQARLRGASKEQLEGWSERILSAATEAELFGE